MSEEKTNAGQESRDDFLTKSFLDSFGWSDEARATMERMRSMRSTPSCPAQLREQSRRLKEQAKKAGY